MTSLGRVKSVSTRRWIGTTNAPGLADQLEEVTRGTRTEPATQRPRKSGAQVCVCRPQVWLFGEIHPLNSPVSTLLKQKQL